MRPFFRALVLATTCAALLAAGAASGAARKSLRIGLDGGYPPFSSRDGDGRPVGFDPEVAAALCTKLEATCETVVIGWAGLFDALLSRKVDLVVASIPITPEARKVVEFTERYHRIAPRFVGRAGDAPRDLSAKGLAGRRIGVRAGTAHATHLAATRSGATLVPFPSEAAAGAALLRRDVDVVFGDTLALYAWLDRTAPKGAAGFVGGEELEPTRFGDGAGIAFRRDDRELGTAVDKALAELGRDGTLDRIAGHWFPFAIR